MPKTAIVIGAGFGGLSAAALLAKKGLRVTVIDNNPMPGGRAIYFRQKGFLFDRGPSWYLMPGVFERFFAEFGKKPSDYFRLVRLSPSYRVFYEEGKTLDVPSEPEKIRALFAQLEPEGDKKLDKYLSQAQYKYDVAMQKFLYKDYKSLLDMADLRLAPEALRLHLFSSIDSYAKRFFKSLQARKILEYTMVFLGGSPSNTPALYSIMSHVDLTLGVWYPMGGVRMLAEAMAKLCEELGVEFHFDEEVKSISTSNGKATGVTTSRSTYSADIIIANADMHHVETELLPPESRTYDEKYWSSRTMAPSALLFYVGINKKLPQLSHHNLFLAEDWDAHFDSIFKTRTWPENPSFYLGCPSRTDPSVAPKGKENLFFLVPVAAGLDDTDEIREEYFQKTISSFEKRIGESIQDDIITSRIVSHRDFQKDFNAYKGTALGLAHTLFQTAAFRPAHRSKKASNLYYTGHYNHPGVGVPMVIISSHIVAEEAVKG